MARTKYFVLLLCFAGFASGCFSGKFESRYDKFTGITTKDGRIGWISTRMQTYAVHAHAKGTRKQIHVYVMNQSPTTLDSLDMLADQQRVNLACLFVREGRKGHITFRLFACDLNPQQISTLNQARALQLRVNGAVATATPEQVANISRVLR